MAVLALWPTALEVMRALRDHYGPAMDQTAVQCGLPIPECHSWLLPAIIFEPENVTVEKLRVRAAYSSPLLIEQRLEQAVDQGFMIQVENNEYHLTELGEVAAKSVLSTGYAKLMELKPLPLEQLEHLACLLKELVKSCLESPEPPGKWCIRYSRKLDLGHNAQVMVRIDQYLSDLAAYRDDSHLAAWQSFMNQGYAWEAFTFLCNAESMNLDELCQKLKHRGYSRSDYQKALEELIKPGWVEYSPGGYMATKQGLQIRRIAEERTDQYFYDAWSILNETQIGELQTMLVSLRDHLLIHDG
jgi:hypothetical protein